MVSDSLRVLEQVAARTGTVVYLEPLNRYQDHMINTLADARRYIVENDLKHVQIIGDFYHMNIEEDNLAQALHDNRDLLGHVHIADNHRYQTGSPHGCIPVFFCQRLRLGKAVRRAYPGGRSCPGVP